jgi:hypothetical protein
MQVIYMQSQVVAMHNGKKIAPNRRVAPLPPSGGKGKPNNHSLWLFFSFPPNGGKDVAARQKGGLLLVPQLLRLFQVAYGQVENGQYRKEYDR